MNPTQADEVKSKMSWADRILNQDESDSASSSDYQSSKGDEYDDEVQHWEDLGMSFSTMHFDQTSSKVNCIPFFSLLALQRKIFRIFHCVFFAKNT